MKHDWPKAFQPLLRKYRNKPHPLEYKNLYQLVVMVVLSAQATDKHINEIAPEFFEAFPDMSSLAAANEESLAPYLRTVRNGRNKATWLVGIAKALKQDKSIPTHMQDLVKLPGIGRKSANVIMRGAKVKAEGVIVDLHVARVAPRIGIATGTDPKKIEEQIMKVIPQKDWGEIGMAISFLGREICRPKNPLHDACVMRDACTFYAKEKKAPVNRIAGKKKKR